MAIVEFTSTDTFMDNDAGAEEKREVEIVGFIQGTYELLRHSGPNDEGTGEEFAVFVEGAWQLPDGARFSDWALTLDGLEPGVAGNDEPDERHAYTA